MTFEDKLNILLSENAQEFADSVGLPRISPWIIKQYNNGHRSLQDYKDIVDWVTNNNPNIDQYDFNNALKQARLFINSNRGNTFDKYMDLNSNQVVLDFENGKKWIKIESDDCNAVCHRLQYDCSRELQSVREGKSLCFALQDPQDNTICIYIDDNPYGQLIGQHGNKPSGHHQETRSLCIKNGFDLCPEAYSHSELVNALASKQLNIDNIKDLSSLFKKLSASDIINCDLINYANYATIKTIYDLYNKTNHDCLLMYCLCYLISYGLTNTSAYNTIKVAVSQNPKIQEIIKTNTSNDNRFYINQLDNSIKEIQKL